MDTLQEQTFKHAKTVNESLTKEITRMEKISVAIEKHVSSQISELKEKFMTSDDRIEKWRINMEDTEGKKFLEIHSAMKVLNQNFQKVANDNKDRFEIIHNECSGLDNAFRQQVVDIRHKIEQDIKLIEERTLMTIEKAYLKQIGGVAGDSKIVVMPTSGDNLGDIDNRLAALKSEMKLYAERVVY